MDEYDKKIHCFHSMCVMFPVILEHLKHVKKTVNSCGGKKAHNFINCSADPSYINR